jgi:NAD(P)-dependent dehydrogenase (short-subunit alcohol dehydrogenase family)
MKLEGQRVLVTGGSRGIGLGIVEALVDAKAQVTVLARDAGRLAEVAQRLGVATIAGDITDRAVAAATLRELRPAVLVLNAGATPPMKPLHEQSWEEFSTTWNTDTKAALFWIQEAIKLPLPRGARVLLGSSGAAVNGSPHSGGHAGAKRMVWLMAQYANGVAAELDLGIRFQAMVPQQIIPTDHGRSAATGYAKKKGVSLEQFYAGFGKPMTPRDVGAHVVTILTDPALESVTAFGLKGDTGLTSLDPRGA